MVAGVVLTSCTSSSPPSSNRSGPADVLSHVAANAAAATYTATYSFRQASSGAMATVQVWRSQPSLRVDVIANGTTATLIVGSDATYACSMTGTRRSCLLVAAAGQPLPAPFSVAPANLFTVDVRQLAIRTIDYDVKVASTLTPTPASSTQPFPFTAAPQCFAVTPRPTAAAPQVPQGTYCFAPDGILTAASYPSGNTIALTSAQVTTPAPGEFTPYAKPTPLPS